eukprot:568798-Amphidinium_carterae.2
MHFVAFGSLAYIAGSQIQADDSDEGVAIWQQNLGVQRMLFAVPGLCQKLFSLNAQVGSVGGNLSPQRLCEPVLFTVWVNRGTAKAVSESEVVSMEALMSSLLIR